MSIVITQNALILIPLFFCIAAKKFGWSVNEAAVSSMTRGYVGDTQFAVLPTIEAIHTMIITVIVQLVKKKGRKKGTCTLETYCVFFA